MVLGSKERDRKRQESNVLPKDIFLVTQLLPTGVHPLKDPSFPIALSLQYMGLEEHSRSELQRLF